MEIKVSYSEDTSLLYVCNSNSRGFRKDAFKSDDGKIKGIIHFNSQNETVGVSIHNPDTIDRYNWATYPGRENIPTEMLEIIDDWILNAVCPLEPAIV